MRGEDFDAAPVGRIAAPAPITAVASEMIAVSLVASVSLISRMPSVAVIAPPRIRAVAMYSWRNASVPSTTASSMTGFDPFALTGALMRAIQAAHARAGQLRPATIG